MCSQLITCVTKGIVLDANCGIADLLLSVYTVNTLTQNIIICQYTSLWGKQTVSKTFTNPSFSLKQVQPSDPFSQIKGNIARMDNHFTSLFQKYVLN